MYFFTNSGKIIFIQLYNVSLVAIVKIYQQFKSMSLNGHSADIFVLAPAKHEVSSAHGLRNRVFEPFSDSALVFALLYVVEQTQSYCERLIPNVGIPTEV